MENYTEHLDLAEQLMRGKDNYGEKFEWDEDKLSPAVIHEFGPQVVVVQQYYGGDREVDTFAIVGFYIPHDGQCTVAVNHMDGLGTLDNADLMFGGEG